MNNFVVKLFIHPIVGQQIILFRTLQQFFMMIVLCFVPTDRISQPHEVVVNVKVIIDNIAIRLNVIMIRV